MRMPAPDGGPELSRVRSSDFLGYEVVLGAVAVGGGEAGMEKPTTEDEGRLEGPGLRRREAHDTGASFGAGAGMGATVEVEASGSDGLGAAADVEVSASDGLGSVVDDKASASDSDGLGGSTESMDDTSGSATGSMEAEVDGSINDSAADDAASDTNTEGCSSGCSGAFAREKEVLVETGEPGTGVSGAVDRAGVVFDSVPSGWSAGAGADALDATSEDKTTGGSGVGDGGGVGRLRAYWMTSRGGRA